ncbi:MAG: hypothetical protein N2561_08175 [Bacteroidetes bacterium]|nr:hypothetical protein [Rhodothermia bacterium]MCS7155417.1 hypothetical protein [Bacteroidota bacterium]MCX7907490.1 hypothetical protein [Bacteroidota bacterium]MDW8138484.1 hypothetical protein [Bacteroidota bacterium]MDW8284579.1 hypothetical protein [Bacteroidota bacterium]
MSLGILVALFVGIAFLIGALLGWIYHHSQHGARPAEGAISQRIASLGPTVAAADKTTAPRPAIPKEPVAPPIPSTCRVDLTQSNAAPGIVLAQYAVLARFAEHEASFEAIAQRLLLRPELQLRNTLAVVSPHRSAGATTIASGLAVTLASGIADRVDPAPVLLVDFHFEDPMLGRLFGIRTAKGLTDYLAGGELAADYFHRLGPYPLWVLPAGHRLQETLFNAQAVDRLRLFLGEMRQRFRWVVLDVGSSPTGTHWLETARPAMLCVAQRGRTRRSELLAVQRFAQANKLEFMGVVLNRVPRRAA